MAMIEKGMEEQEIIIKVLQEIMTNHDLWRHILVRYQVDAERMLILRQILLQLSEYNREEILWKIMEYGSKIREEDRIARQIFLWLYSYI